MAFLSLFKRARPSKIVPLFNQLPKDMRVDAVAKVRRIFPDTTSELLLTETIVYYAIEFKTPRPNYFWQVNKKVIKNFFQRRNYQVISIILH